MKASHQLSRRSFADGFGVALLAAGVAGASTSVLAAPSSAVTDMEACIDLCHRCETICLSMATSYCLARGGAHAAPAHIRLMLDCAQICATTAEFMARKSAHHARICRVCAEICMACAKSCDGLDGMEACLKLCRDCAESCRRMAEMGDGVTPRS